ncbi:MAG TPA: ferredoxin [Candidatus Nanoarchaeia archaeon]|nr:ferredoxin [Candidatus Nanoarchaeia archaeon]
MAKYKVVYDRENCIGAFACVAVFPEKWLASDDGKADFKDAIKNGKGEFELEIDEKDLAKMKESAEVCPVMVIHIYDMKGNKII